jgi:hypothetical protein
LRHQLIWNPGRDPLSWLVARSCRSIAAAFRVCDG